MNCKNCDTEITSNYCPNCGQAKSLKRIDRHYIIHEIEHVLHFERGILYTIRELTTNPGQNIQKYLSENRSRLVKPIIFIVITSLIYTLLNHFFHFEDGYVNSDEVKISTTASIQNWLQDHYGYANIMMGVFIALWLKLFFKKHNYNVYEIMIMLCFVMGIGMLIFSVFILIEGLSHFKLIAVAGIACLVYCTWAIGYFFEKKKAMSYVKAFVAYVIGMITFWTVPYLIGTIIDLLNK
jgi:glutaredoxin